uniref:Uncharacterized protein n=1 Tax=Arundo donax TaxID=35708 RepID=A0A0A9HTL5_ARUDO
MPGLVEASGGPISWRPLSMAALLVQRASFSATRLPLDMALACKAEFVCAPFGLARHRSAARSPLK